MILNLKKNSKHTAVLFIFEWELQTISTNPYRDGCLHNDMYQIRFCLTSETVKFYVQKKKKTEVRTGKSIAPQ